MASINHRTAIGFAGDTRLMAYVDHRTIFRGRSTQRSPQFQQKRNLQTGPRPVRLKRFESWLEMASDHLELKGVEKTEETVDISALECACDSVSTVAYILSPLSIR